MSRPVIGYEIAGRGHPAGFCALCWKFTEERMAPIIVSNHVINNSRKFSKPFVPIEYPTLSAEIIFAAQKLLEEFIADSKMLGGYTLEESLYSLIPSYDFRALENGGLESREVLESLIDEIEQEVLRREWYSKIAKLPEFKISVGEVKIVVKDGLRASTRPSSTFCPDHNPNHSIESRQRYQNDRKRITEFENEINTIFRDLEKSRYAWDSEDDLQKLLQFAYSNVFSSTLEKILKLKNEGKNQTEIAKILSIGRQAVSIALKREKQRIAASAVVAS